MGLEDQEMAPKKGSADPGFQSVRLPEKIVSMARKIDSVSGDGVGKIIADAAEPALKRLLTKMNEEGKFLPPEDDD